MFYSFLENVIKAACLNSAQNLISEINSQKENFMTLSNRLIEVRKENPNETIPYGII